MPRPLWVRYLVPISWVILMGGLIITSRGEPAAADWSGLSLAAIGTLEAAMIFLLLRPPSYDYHMGRGLLVLVLMVVLSTYWAASAPLIAIPAYTVHLLWLMALVVVICVLLAFALWQQLQARHQH